MSGSEELGCSSSKHPMRYRRRVNVHPINPSMRCEKREEVATEIQVVKNGGERMMPHLFDMTISQLKAWDNVWHPGNNFSHVGKHKWQVLVARNVTYLSKKYKYFSKEYVYVSKKYMWVFALPASKEQRMEENLIFIYLVKYVDEKKSWSSQSIWEAFQYPPSLIVPITIDDFIDALERESSDGLYMEELFPFLQTFYPKDEPLEQVYCHYDGVSPDIISIRSGHKTTVCSLIDFD
jgi:hypothetical protein